MKLLNIGATKYKNPKTGQFESLPCLKGDKGDSGEGIPAGGTSGQILAKNTNDDYDTHWINLPTTGGGSSVTIDNTLTQSGTAADAKATGDAIKAATHTHSNKDVLDSITGIVTKGKNDNNDSENPNFNNTDLISLEVFNDFAKYVNGKNKEFDEALQYKNDELIISVAKNEDSYVIDKTDKEIDEYMVNNNRNSLFVLFPDETDSTKNYIAKLYKQEFTPGKNDSSGNAVLPKTVLYFRAWLSETELVDITITMQSADITVIPPVTVEKKTIVPSTLPNPNKLTLSGLVTAEYDGSSEVSVNIPSVCPVINIKVNPSLGSKYIVESGTYEKITNLLEDPHVSNIFASITYDSKDNTKSVSYGILQECKGKQYIFKFFTGYSNYDTYYINENDTVTFESESYLTQDNVVMDLDQTYEFDWGRPISVMVAKTLRDSIPPADLVVTVTATSNDEYQSDTTFEQIRNASGDVRLILKGGTDVPDLHGNLIILHNGGAIFKVTSNPSTNGYIIIDSKNTVHVEHYCDIYAVQISKLNNNKYTCNNTTFEDLLEIINTTSNVIVEYNGYVGYLETQPTSEATTIAFNVIKDDAIVRILIDNTDNVTVKETPLGSNSFIVKVTPTFSNNDTTYSSDHSFSEIKEAYDKGLNPIVIYNNYAICQMVCINLLEAKFVSPSSSVESYNITIDKNNVAVDEFNIITSDKVIPDLDRVLDTMDPIYPSTYPVSAQAIGKLRDSIKESIPTKLSQLESRDYNSLENKPIVSINNLIDKDKFTYTETQPNAKGFVTRTYKFIINPDLDFNDRLFRVDVPDNVGNIMILIVTKKTDGSDYLTYYIMGAGNGEILAINTDKANKMMVVNRVFTGSRMLIEFDDTGCYKNSTSYFSVYKSDVLTKTNTVEFTPEKDYHPATKKYVDDAIAALKAELTGSTGESTETENHGKSV